MRLKKVKNLKLKKMKKEHEQIKFHHQLRKVKPNSLVLEHKDKVTEYNNKRKEKINEKIKYMKSKGFVTDDIWVLTMGGKI